MALSDINKSSLAFKNTQGKAHTATNKELGNEEEPYKFIVGADTVWLSDITSLPDLSIVEGITASLLPDLTSNGRAFFSYYPEGHAKAGQRIYNVVPHSFGNAYEAVIKGSDGSRIVEFDARDWVYQYQPGIFFQQTANASPTPTSASFYIYKGATLSSSIADGGVALGGGSSPQWSSTPQGFATTSSVAFAGPAVTFSGSGIVWSNQLANSYTVQPGTRDLNLTAIYPMTGSVSNHGTIFALDVPISGAIIDGDIVIMGKSPDINNRGHFKFNIVSYNSSSRMNTPPEPLTVVMPDIKTDTVWDYNVDIDGTRLLFSVTGSTMYNIDWSFHARFYIA
jgi:hypothetical protein